MVITTMEIGRTGRNMGMGSTNGLMENSILENTEMGKKKVKESTHFQVGRFTVEIG